MKGNDDAAITADGLRKRYGAVQAVDGVSLSVRRGEFFGLLGPNGAGSPGAASASCGGGWPPSAWPG